VASSLVSETALSPDTWGLRPYFLSILP